jgi:hypothetical protein
VLGVAAAAAAALPAALAAADFKFAGSKPATSS